MGTSASLTIKDNNDFISMDTRWDGYDDYVLKKLNKEESILKFRSKLEEFIKGKEMNSQIEFLTNWISSIDRFLAGDETISKVATLISFGDFSHFKTTVENINFNGSNNIDDQYIIEKVNGEFKFVFDEEEVEERLELEKKEITKEKYLEILKENKNITYLPITQKSMHIKEKPLEKDDLLIKVCDDNGEEGDFLPKDFSTFYIKMKKGSAEKFAEIIQSLAFNYAYLYEVGEFGLNEVIKKNEITKKAKELEEQGMNYIKAYKKVRKDLNQDDVSLGIYAEYSLNMFSYFKYDNEKSMNRASENVNNGLEPAPLDNIVRDICSFPPFYIYPESLFHQLVFFYPDMFEVLTASEMKYIVDNNKKSDIICKLVDKYTCKIIIDFKGLLSHEKLTETSAGFNNVEKYINENFNQSLLDITLKDSENVSVSWNRPLIEGSKVSYNYELAVATTMNAYDNFLFKKYINSIKNIKALKP